MIYDWRTMGLIRGRLYRAYSEHLNWMKRREIMGVGDVCHIPRYLLRSGIFSGSLVGSMGLLCFIISDLNTFSSSFSPALSKTFCRWCKQLVTMIVCC